MKVAIVVPAHNEEENIEKLVNDIDEILRQSKIENQIIIVDDNSKDNTSTILKNLSKGMANLTPVYRSDGICGVGLTLREGIKAAKNCDVIVTMDGDFSHDPNEISNLIQGIKSGADLVIGSRYMKGGRADMPRSRIIISGLYNVVSRVFLRTSIHDLTTGFRAMRKKALEKIELTSEGFEIHPEIHLKIYKQRLKVIEVPIHYHRRGGGTSKLRYLKVGPGYLKVVFRQLLKQ
jgi:dolichol-phosphate mannosyltransferase